MLNYKFCDLGQLCFISLKLESILLKVTSEIKKTNHKMDNKMKKLVSLILLSLFLVVGCQDDNSILEPTNNISEASPSQKGRVILPAWIRLPEKNSLSKLIRNSDGWTVTVFVPSDKNMKIEVKEEYEAGIHGKVKVDVQLKIEKGTFDSDRLLTMNVNDQNGTVTFEPSLTLNQHAELIAKFEGIDLTNYREEDVSFGYLDGDKTIQQAIFKEIKVDIDKGKLELKDGIVSNFTTFGWTVPNYDEYDD